MIPVLADIPMDALVAAMPKADLHLHQEAEARIDRLLARRKGEPPYDWRGWATRLLAETPPGMPRLDRMVASRRRAPEMVDALDADPEIFVARVVDQLEEGAADGAILIEIRFGRATVLRPDFIPLFREAERRVQRQYPRLRAEAIISGLMPSADGRNDHLLDACLDAAGQGLAGIDFIPVPYNVETDWTAAYRWAERAAAAGLGITAHAGEFSGANVAAALRLPGLTRLGHGVHAAADPRLLDELARRQITVECSLSSNVVLGATPSYEEHPIRRFLNHGIPVALSTDDPVRLCTTIGREYAIAAALGFSASGLLAFTRNAVEAAFVPFDRRASLLAELAAWEEGGRIA